MSIDLNSYYAECMKRLVHEYNLRDRDFVMHTTLEAALFAAVGFMMQYLKYDKPASWILVGFVVAIVSFFGKKVAVLLVDSVKSFTYWQTFIQDHAASIEAVMLPEGTKGLHVSAQEAKGKIKDLTMSRLDIAEKLVIVWRVVGFTSVLLVTLGLIYMLCKQSRPCIDCFIKNVSFS